MTKPVYPAVNNQQAVDLNILNSNVFHNIVNGDATTDVQTYEGNGTVPSVLKALTTMVAYKAPIDWQSGSVENDILQPRVYTNLLFVPIKVPAPMGDTPTDSHWKLYMTDVSSLLTDKGSNYYREVVSGSPKSTFTVPFDIDFFPYGGADRPQANVFVNSEKIDMFNITYVDNRNISIATPVAVGAVVEIYSLTIASVTMLEDLKQEAAASAADAEETLKDFRNIYYGSRSSDPTTRPDGSAMQDGDLYKNTATTTLRVYDAASGIWGLWDLGDGTVTREKLAAAIESAVPISVKEFGAAGDGATDDTAAIQAAIDAVWASGGGVVFFPAGVYIIGATIYLRQGVFLRSIGWSATIKQKTAGGLNVLVDFSTYSAHYAGIDGLIVDGDLTNNQKDVATERFAVFVGAANYASVINTKIRNYAGHGVYVSSGMRPIVNDNILENLYSYGVYINHPVLSAYNRPEVCRNRILDVSWHAIMVTRSRQARICDNTIEAKGFHGHVVTVSGTTCTLVSGPDFSGVKPGNFLIYDGGIEALVFAVNSPTQLTLHSATGNRTAVAGAMGAADVITSMGCHGSLIRGNFISGGASLGISVFSNELYGSEIHPKVIDNMVEAVGSAGFSAQSSGAASTIAPLFDGNTAAYCGLNGSASDTNANSGLTVSGNCDFVTVTNNSWHAFGSSMYGLNILTTGAVVRAANNISNTAITSIQNGATVTLSAGWNGATVSELVVGEDTLSFLVTTTSTVPFANPSIAITHRVRPLRNKIPTFTLLLTSANFLPVQTYFPLSDTTSVGVIAGTPSPDSTYRFVVRL